MKLFKNDKSEYKLHISNQSKYKDEFDILVFTESSISGLETQKLYEKVIEFRRDTHDYIIVQLSDEGGRKTTCIQSHGTKKIEKFEHLVEES